MDMEESLKVIEEMIKSYKEADKCGLSNNDFKNEIKALEYIVSDYKRLHEEFKDVDHECDRLEQKELRLEKENQKLKEDISHMYDKDVIINIMCDEFNISKSEALELLGEEE